MDKRNTKFSLITLILIEGFLVMGIELSSSLIIKPFYGSSMEVWTYILGITLSALCLGYFFGFWLSKKSNILLVTYYLFILLSIAIFLIPFTSKYLFRQLYDSENIIYILSLSITPFLFPPLFILGSISTLIVKLFEDYGLSSSNSASKTYFFSTLGGVLALFLIAFYIIDNLTTYQIIFLLSAIPLIALSIMHFVLKTSKFYFGFLAVFILFSVYYFNTGINKIRDVFPNHIKEVYNNDGLLGQIIVMKDFATKTKLLMVNNSNQTASDFNGRGNYFHVKKISDFLNQAKIKGKILIAGLGGGSLVYELSYKDYDIDVIELDKRMIEVSNKHFLKPKESKVNFIIDDARHIINSNKNKYEVIILDLSIGENIPSNVYTLESFKNIRTMLSKEGVLFINFFSKDNSDGLNAVNAIGKTMSVAGFTPMLLNRNRDSLNMSSFVFYASNSKKYDEIEKKLCSSFEYQKGQLLIDDNSKLELIHKNITIEQRKNYIINYQKYFSKK